MTEQPEPQTKLVPYSWDEPSLRYVAKCRPCSTVVAFVTMEALHAFPEQAQVPLWASHRCNASQLPQTPYTGNTP